MGYRNVKDYFVKRLAGLKFHESSSKFSLASESENFDSKYVIENLTTNLEDGNVLQGRYYPQREITVKLAKRYSESGQIKEYDDFVASLDTIVRELQNPVNFQAVASNLKNVRFLEQNVSIEGSYFLAEIKFAVFDLIVYP